MIGSLMSRMGMAEKLSVAQLQKAVQDGTLPAYVGVPLIQDKLKQEKLAKTAATGMQQQQPPIAQQVMQEASQRGIDEAQSNLPEVSMAGGGIVAFAGGDLVEDDDEEDTSEERQLAAETQSLFNQAAGRVHEGMESGHGIGSISPKESREIAYSINPESKGGIGIKDMLAAKAAQNKLPPELLNKIAGTESGYKSTAANPNSSAKGLFQFTDATWKGMGGKEGEQFDPEKNAELGAKFVRQNAEGLRGALGRNPTYGEVYASHMFGLKGAKDLLNMDPRTPMDKAVSAQVLKANPQLKDKTVGQVMASLNNKMGEGIVALAKGGAVKYYGDPTENPTEDQVVKPDTPDDGEATSAFSRFFDQDARLKQYNAQLEAQRKLEKVTREQPGLFTKQTPKEQAKSQSELQTAVNERAAPTLKAAAVNTANANKGKNIGPGLTYEEMLAGSSRAGTQAAMDKDETSGIAIPPMVSKEEGKGIDSAIEKEPSIEQKYMDLLKGRESGVAKQRSIDNYMALLQAGLGMMGGTSPYAMTNIGQGASTGIAAKMAAEKNRIAEEAATMKGYGNLYNIQQNAEMRKTLAGQSQEAAQRKVMGTNLLNMESKIRSGIQASLDKSMNTMGMSDEQKQAKINELTAKALSEDQTYRNMFKAYNGFDFAAPSAGPNYVQSAEERLKNRGLK